MRISDWSSDVCSSDLNAAPPSQPQRQQHRRNWLSRKARRIGQRSIREGRAGGNVATGAISGPLGLISDVRQGRGGFGRHGALRASQAADFRSEEHTSELQSLMRISYAVFCLKKKN